MLSSGQILGAAAKDPAVQTAAEQTFADPSIQAASWKAARSTAESVAHRGAQAAQSGFLEVHTYIQESHCGVRLCCFCIALALLASSVLGILNVFNALFAPYNYLWAVYNTIFALIIIIIDGKPEWYARCGNIQARLFSNAAFLASWSGRALLYFYVGSINLVMLPNTLLWKAVYLGIGGGLCAVGVLLLLQRIGCCARREAQMLEP